MKINSLLISCVCLLSSCFVNSNSYNTSNVTHYENVKKEEFAFNDYQLPKNLTEEEIVQYYIENDIFPCNASDSATKQLEYSEVENHLISRFGGSEWSIYTSKSVSDIYSVNPKEVNEWNPDIQIAKQLANNTKQYIGCGPLALFCELDYLVRGPGYYELGYEPDSVVDKRLLAKDIITSVSTISSDSWIGQLISAPEGTFTFPSDFISGARQVLEVHKLSVKKEKINDEGKTEYYYDNDSQILVHGDTIPNLSFFNTKVSNIKDSIDKGMPVVWWTTGGAGEFSNHFMNIFGYETWKSTNSSGEEKEHLMFKLRFNWGINDIYMDSDTIDAVNGGFIFFEETRKHIGLHGEDYNFECAYNNAVSTKNISKHGYNILTTRLRTGYVNHFTNNILDDQRLTLSSKRNNYKEAYLRWEFSKPIQKFAIGLSKWSSNEWPINNNDGRITISYVGDNGKWSQEINESKFSCIYEYPDTFTYTFPEYLDVRAIEVNLTSMTGGNDRNKGRIVISGTSVIFHELV